MVYVGPQKCLASFLICWPPGACQGRFGERGTLCGKSGLASRRKTKRIAARSLVGFDRCMLRLKIPDVSWNASGGKCRWYRYVRRRIGQEAYPTIAECVRSRLWSGFGPDPG